MAAPPAVAEPEPAGDDRQERAPRSRVRWVVAAVVVLVAAVVTAFLLRPPSTPPVTQGDVARAVQQGLDKAAKDGRNAPPDATAAYQKALPSIVVISM